MLSVLTYKRMYLKTCLNQLVSINISTSLKLISLDFLYPPKLRLPWKGHELPSDSLLWGIVHFCIRGYRFLFCVCTSLFISESQVQPFVVTTGRFDEKTSQVQTDVSLSDKTAQSTFHPLFSTLCPWVPLLNAHLFCVWKRGTEFMSSINGYWFCLYPPWITHNWPPTRRPKSASH